MSVRVKTIFPVETFSERMTKNVSILLPLASDEDGENGDGEDMIFRLKQLLGEHRGACPVFLEFREREGGRAVIEVGRENFVTPSPALFDAIESTVGKRALGVNQR